MIRESLLKVSISLSVAVISMQGYASNQNNDDYRVVKWEINDYKNGFENNSSAKENIAISAVKPLLDVDMVTHIVSSGDNVKGILFKNGVVNTDINNLIYNSKNSKSISMLKIGQRIDIYKNGKNLEKLVLHNNEYSSIMALKKSGGEYVISDYKTPFSISKKHVVAKITKSLSETLVANNVSSEQSSSINKALSGTVNLNNLKNGDSLNLIIEERVIADGSVLGYGDILAVELITSGVKHGAYLHNGSNGRGYYNASGVSLDASFLRHPLKNVRVTSRFNPNRIHPIFKKVAPHRGTDYGAPRGTPVYAASDGIVKSASTKRGYGNVVIIEHGRGYKTLYAHLNKYNTKSGAKVRKGDVIGFVGSTGYATGPHLHYELIVNGRQVDSAKAKIPSGNELKGDQLAKFKGNVQSIAMSFDRARKSNEQEYIVATRTSKDSNKDFKYFE